MNAALTAIRKKLKHLDLKWRPTLWLDTGIPDLNNVMGHAKKGMPYGKMWEISGWESSGKSAVMLSIAALAQRNGAHIIWGDIENSFMYDWAILRGILRCPHCLSKDSKLQEAATEKCTECNGSGIDEERFTLIQPYAGKFEDDKEERMASAQELCQEIEECIKFKRKEDRLFVVVDSIASLETDAEQKAGVTGGSNMRVKMDQSMFIGRLCRRWGGLCQTHNAMIILINQLRQGPATGFGDPTYTPGGNGPRFYSHVRVRMSRVMNSRINDKGKIVGIKGIMKAKKNKAGGEEYAEVGYRLWFKKGIEFVSAKDIKAKE